MPKCLLGPSLKSSEGPHCGPSSGASFMLGLFCLEKAQEDLISLCIHTWWEGMKAREPDSSWWSPLTGPEAMGTD